MKPKTRKRVLDKAKSLFNRRNRPRSSSRVPGENPPAGSVAASAPSPSGVYLEPSRISSKERSSFSSATPSRSSSVVPSAVDTPLYYKTNPKPSKPSQLSQIPASHSLYLSSIPSINSPSPDLSPVPLAVPELQPIQCCVDSSSGSPIIMPPEARAFPETFPSTPPLLPDLWSRAIDEAKGESETLKWLQKRGLVSTDGKPQMSQKSTETSQSRLDKKTHIEELISLVEANKLSEQNDKPLKIPVGNREIIARDYVANTAAFITKVGDIAFSLAPVEASAPWAITKAVLKIPVHQIEQKAALLGTAKWFISIVRRGQIYEDLYTVETTDKKGVQGLHDGLLQVYIAAIKMLAKSDTLFNSKTARQTLTAILEPGYASDSIKNLVEKEKKLDREIYACEASRSVISSSLMNTQIKVLEKQLYQLSSPLPQIEKGVAGLLARLEEDKLKELLEFISPEMFGKSHATVVEKRVSNTGDWLLASKEFHAWQRTPASAVLCLKGTIGTGKTYLTSKAIDHIKQAIESSPQHDEGFAFFYCNRSGPSMQDPLLVLKSFVRQLAAKAFDTSGVIQYSLIQRCETIKKEKRDFNYKDCEDLLLESFNLYSRTTIVLDALDETDITEYNLGAILTTLMEKSENSIKIFISSRPDREYLEAFEDETIIAVDANNQQKDIEAFLVEKLYTTKFFQQRSQVIQNEIRNVFATRSRGMFRWVYLQVMSLKRLITDKAIYNWACNLPVDLMAAYDRLWETIKEHDEADVALAERAIMWVLCSLKPLKTAALLQAIRYIIQGSILLRNEEQTQQQILSLCQDLLTIDEGRGVWMLPHASVAEYFVKRGQMSLWECDIFASRLCLNFLVDHHPIPNDDGHFSSYVAQFWHKHVARYDKWLGSKEQEADPDLAAALKRFLGSPGKSSASFREWARGVTKGIQIRTTLSVVCQYGFYYTLRDWWTQPGTITAEMVLKEGGGSTILGLAAQGYCMPICRHLAKLIEALHPKGDAYYTRALTEAIYANNFDMVKFLVREVKADVNFTSPRPGNNSAAQAAAIMEPEKLQWLVDQGIVDLERENDSGSRYGNVLITAVAWENFESVRILLKAGANADAVVQHGKYGSALVAAASALVLASFGSEMVRLLLDHGADPKRPMRGGQYGSALEASVARDWEDEYEEDRRKLLLLLLEAGADPAAVFDHGNFGSALAAAAFWGHRDSLKAMVDRAGAERAIEALRHSRHPDERKFRDKRDIMRWNETATYLAEEVGVNKEILHTIGFWDVEPEPYDGIRYISILRYNKQP
ncbi:hypothetical protein GGI43DRAFT_390035 [Trichoderma evansii]